MTDGWWRLLFRDIEIIDSICSVIIQHWEAIEMTVFWRLVFQVKKIDVMPVTDGDEQSIDDDDGDDDDDW